MKTLNLIKSLKLSILLALVPSIVLAGKGSDGGADAIKIMAKDYTNTTRLENAYMDIDSRLESSQLPTEYKEKIRIELRSLIDKNKFKELPEIIIFKGNSEVEGYVVSETEGEFLSLGAMTNFHPSEPVYLAERIEKYTDAKFNNIILHETLHHVLPMGLTADEHFVDKMTADILNNEDLSIVNNALKLKGLYREEYFSRDGFIELGGFADFAINWTRSFYRDKDSAVWSKYRTIFIGKLNAKLPKDLSNTSLIDFINSIDNSMDETAYTQDYAQHFSHILIPKQILNSIIKINPRASFRINKSIGCKKKLRFFKDTYDCKKQDQILMKDLLK